METQRWIGCVRGNNSEKLFCSTDARQDWLSVVLCLRKLSFADYRQILFNNSAPEVVVLPCKSNHAVFDDKSSSLYSSNQSLMKRTLSLLLLCAFIPLALQAQDFSSEIRQYLLENQSTLRWSKSDIAQGWQVSDQFMSKHNQVTHVYLQQMIHGLKLHNAITTVALQKGAVEVFKSRYIPQADQMTNVLPGAGVVDARKAVQLAAASVSVSLDQLKETAVAATTDLKTTFTALGARAPIQAWQVYQSVPTDIRLAWHVEIQSGSDWWNIRVDAMTGEILEKHNYTVYCSFHPTAYCHQTHHATPTTPDAPAMATPGYRVFPFPGESPNHTTHQLIDDPSDPVASPFGWHDTDGQPGAEYTITRGNNVLASEDRDDNNIPGFSPDGGANLIFDFPYDPVLPAVDWQSAAITNLFYANNYMHDITHRRGFDAPSGNYQENNYGEGGLADDAVQADAQDGSGTNNANFQAPPDGTSGRMQMYIWNSTSGLGDGDSISINTPASIAGKYYAPIAAFGPTITSPVTGDIAQIKDNVDPFGNGCDSIVNAAELAGKIVLIDRGLCSTVTKVQAAQNAGAIAVVIVNNSGTPPSSLPGTSATINIPTVMVSLAHGQLMRDALLTGAVNISLLPTVSFSDPDSDLDNGIIAHEYGHGISIRLTGGASNSGCLGNAEQMGEGWSDYYALITTMRPGDTRNTPRPIGTYALTEPTTGDGIRNQVYSTDMAVNDYTYRDVSFTQGAVHDIGEIWATMLWDLTWDLIDVYGYEPNLLAETGGNNIAHQLVTDGYKLQPCSPGFVDGRDAILEADRLYYNGANKCLIWKAFARRGLGYSASQGSSGSHTDGVEAFDLPPQCLVATEAPIAGFSVDKNVSCVGKAYFQFQDASQNIAQSWLWDFGDGATSTEVNPSHYYANEGVYTVTLIVSNNISSDTLVMPNFVSVVTVPAPTVNGALACEGGSVALSLIPAIAGNTGEWLDASGNSLFIGNVFQTPVINGPTTFQVREVENTAIQQVGPATFGTGGNHANNFVRQVLFTAEKALTIRTVWVRASGGADREIRLYNSNGDVIAATTKFIPNGDSRVTLNIEVPGPGDYALGAGPNINLYRNNSGTVYPFTIPGLLSITGSNAGQSGAYYYFYDWEVQETPCRSATSEVSVSAAPGPLAAFTFQANQLAVSFSDASTGSPVSWFWEFGDGTTASVANPSHTYTTPGQYTVGLTVSDGNCSSYSAQTVNFTSSTNGIKQDALGVTLHPNPATEQVNIVLQGLKTSKTAQVSLLRIDGQLVQRRTYEAVGNNVLTLDLKGAAPGIYLVKIETPVGVSVKKLIVH
jgi:PKD repeat protein